jgi:hypothetical protein
MDDERGQAGFWRTHDVAQYLSHSIRYVLTTATGLYTRVVGGGNKSDDETETENEVPEPLLLQRARVPFRTRSDTSSVRRRHNNAGAHSL